MRLLCFIIGLSLLTLISTPVQAQDSQPEKPSSEMTHAEMVEAWKADQQKGVENHKDCLLKIKNDWPDQGGGFLDDVSEAFKKDARIIYRGFPATADHVPGRMNIIVDPETKEILGLSCG